MRASRWSAATPAAWGADPVWSALFFELPEPTANTVAAFLDGLFFVVRAGKTSMRFAKMGIKAETSIDFPKMMGFKQEAIDGNTKGIDFLLKKNKVTVFMGAATIMPEVEAGGAQILMRNAAGARRADALEALADLPGGGAVLGGAQRRRRRRRRGRGRRRSRQRSCPDPRSPGS